MNLNLRAVTNPPTVGVVHFYANGVYQVSHTHYPYCLGYDNDGDYYPTAILKAPGYLNVTAVPVRSGTENPGIKAEILLKIES
jgi:hypothetical protein